MTDWTTVLVAAISASAALGAGLGAQMLTARGAARSEAAATANRRRDERRDALHRLLVATEVLDSFTGGALASGRLVDPPSEVLRELANARVAVLLLVEPEVVEDLLALVTAVVTRSNAFRQGVMPHSRDNARRAAVDQGLADESTVDALRERFLVAARRTLN